jgi:hypothetical protein
VLTEEDSLGIAVFQALDAAQQKTATISETVPNDIFTAEKRRAEPLEPLGLTVEKMTPEQRSRLETLIREYLGRYRTEFQDRDWAEITTAGWEKVQFAWIGAPEAGKPHYYRIQGPTFLFEYDNIQNNARHPHAVWRKFQGDFGLDVLSRHHQEQH